MRLRGSSLDPARARRSGAPIAVFGDESAALLSYESELPPFDPVFEAAEAVLEELLELPRPGCDICGGPAEFAYLNVDSEATMDPALACANCEVRGGFTLPLDLSDEDWTGDLAANPLGLAVLVLLLQRLKEEDKLRWLRKKRGL